MAKFVNRSPLYTGPGNNVIVGYSDKEGVENLSKIYMQAGNDRIEGRGGLGYDGIFNNDHISLDSGNDEVVAVGGVALGNQGLLDAGTGNDRLIATGQGTGIFNTFKIRMGLGDDVIVASAAVRAIDNFRTIDTGAGNDRITAAVDPVTGQAAISNDGLIHTDSGNDVVDALVGGFSGTGLVSLGLGADVLRGFGSGSFTGGLGQDQMLLGEGVYVIKKSSASRFLPKVAGMSLVPYLSGISRNNVYSISSGGKEMNVAMFESIGGVNGGLFSLASGTLSVNQSGVATFQPI